jgi:hypothetical protein
MKKIYRDQNYIIIEADGGIIAIPASSSLYSNIITGTDRQEAAFQISGINSIRYVIIDSEIIAGDWVDDNSIAYDINTFTAFVRGNTGY